MEWERPWRDERSSDILVRGGEFGGRWRKRAVRRTKLGRVGACEVADFGGVCFVLISIFSCDASVDDPNTKFLSSLSEKKDTRTLSKRKSFITVDTLSIYMRIQWDVTESIE